VPANKESLFLSQSRVDMPSTPVFYWWPDARARLW